MSINNDISKDGQNTSVEYNIFGWTYIKYLVD